MERGGDSREQINYMGMKCRAAPSSALEERSDQRPAPQSPSLDISDRSSEPSEARTLTQLQVSAACNCEITGGQGPTLLPPTVTVSKDLGVLLPSQFDFPDAPWVLCCSPLVSTFSCLRFFLV